MFSALELTLLLLGFAVLGVVAFRMLHLPPMLGYLVVVFSIGLEFSLPKLSSMRTTVFGLGMAQVLLTIGAVMLSGWVAAYTVPQLSNVSWQAAFALGGALAMSSTAIVSKLLTERMELE